MRISTFYKADSTIEAFSWLRFVCARSYELWSLPRLDSDDFDLARRPIEPLSAENEADALTLLARLAQEQLGAYPTTLEEDVALLASGKFPYGSNRRNALVLVKGEKEVCRYYINLASVAVPMLTGTTTKWPDLSAAIARNHGGTGELDVYVRSVVGPLVRKKWEASGGGIAAAAGGAAH